MNRTLSLLQQRVAPSKILEQLVGRYGLSRRQAYRYLHQARQSALPLPVPEEKAVFTVKLPRRLIHQVRRRAQAERRSISSWVEGALQQALSPP